MKIEFEFDSKYGVYRDCLNLNDDHTLSEQDIENMKLQRFNKWVDMIENPPVIVEEPVVTQVITEE